MGKFEELCAAYGKAQSQFGDFQNGCHLISMQLVEELKSYFEIPLSQFSLYKVGDKGEFNLVRPSLINALTLRSDSLYDFGIGLTVCSAPEAFPQELILIHICIRHDLKGKYYLSYANQEKECELEKKEEYNFIPFFDYLHETIIKSYDEQMQNFIGQDTRREIGYNKK